MDFAAFLSSIVATPALFAVGSILGTGTDRKRPAILVMSEVAVLFIGIAALTSIATGCHRPNLTTDEKVVSTTDEKVVTNRPIEVSEGGYVSSQNCRSCHPHQYDTWQSSYHSTMTRVTTPQSVEGPFDNVPLVLDGANYLLLRRGDQFFVRMDDPAKVEPGRGPSTQHPMPRGLVPSPYSRLTTHVDPHHHAKSTKQKPQSIVCLHPTQASEYHTVGQGDRTSNRASCPDGTSCTHWVGLPQDCSAHLANPPGDFGCLLAGPRWCAACGSYSNYCHWSLGRETCDQLIVVRR